MLRILENAIVTESIDTFFILKVFWILYIASFLQFFYAKEIGSGEKNISQEEQILPGYMKIVQNGPRI